MTIRSLLRPAWVALVVQLVACGSDSETKPATDPGDGGADAGLGGDGGFEEQVPDDLSASPGQLALRVDQARQVITGGESGDLEVAFTLANGAGAPPAALNPALFQVKTADGLYVSVAVGSTYWTTSPACDSALSVGAGASYSCSLKFAVDTRTKPVVELTYRTANEVAGVGDDRRTASAPLTLEACETCDQDCTYLDVDPTHCGTCGRNVLNLPATTGGTVSAACRAGRPECPEDVPTLCDYQDASGMTQSACADVMTSTSFCGDCDTRVLNGTCENGVPSCYEPTLVTCGNRHCVDTTTDDDCGGCGLSCGDKGRCGTLGQSPSTYACITGSYIVFSDEPDPSWGEQLLPSADATCDDACKSIGWDGCSGASGCNQPPEIGSGGTKFVSCYCYATPKAVSGSD